LKKGRGRFKTLPIVQVTAMCEEGGLKAARETVGLHVKLRYVGEK